MITKFVLNSILHHVGMSWITSSNDEMEYEIDESNHQYWLNKGPWYNTAIYSRSHGSMLEDFITHARTDILLNYVRVPRQRTAPDRANIASASAHRPMLPIRPTLLLLQLANHPLMLISSLLRIHLFIRAY